MALTQGAWLTAFVNKRFVASCTVSGTTAENDLYTLKTPEGYNPTKPCTLIVNVTEDLTAAGTSVVNIWGGYADDFAITGNDSTVAATSGAQLVAGTTDVDAGGIFAFRIIPGTNPGTANVTTNPGAIFTIPPMPYLAFNVNMSAVLQDVADVTFIIVQ